MTVSTVSLHGKEHTTECPSLFEALELVEGLLVLGPWKSVKIDDNEFIQGETECQYTK